MKIFRTIGIIAVILLFVSAFLPWVYIDAGSLHHATLTGMDTGATTYGKPALLGLIFAALFFPTVIIPRVWAKRVGIFFAVVVIAWTIKNFYMFQCEMGYCPVRKIGLYLSVFAALGIMISALLPYVPDKYRKD